MNRSSFIRPIGAAALLLACWANTAVGQVGLDLKLGHRLVHRFDFEEAQYHNFEDLPMHWYVIGRQADTANPTFTRQPLHQELTTKPGYPNYGIVRFDRPQRHQGPHRLLMGLTGGSAGAFLEVGALPAVPGSDYLITCNVRTTQMQRAGAKLTAYLIDGNGQRIDASVAATPLTRTDGQWKTIGVKLRGEFLEAAWIGLELEAVQPQPPPDSLLGHHQIVLQDVRGWAWFDDVRIWQLPHVTVRTQNPMNLIPPTQKPQLSIEVRDFSGQQLRAESRLYNHRHRLVAHDDQWVGQSAPKSWIWRPALDRYGWYLLDLRINETPQGSSTPRTIARSVSAFLWLGDHEPLSDHESRRFLLLTGALGQTELELLPSLLNATGLGAVTVAVWQPTTTQSELEQRTILLDELVQSLSEENSEVLLNLAPLPRELAHQLDIDAQSPIDLFTHPDDSWKTYLGPALMRLGQRVHLWQMGAIDHAGDLPPLDHAQRAESVQQKLRELAPRPQPVLPWRLHWPLPSSTPPTAIYALDVPTWVAPDTIPRYLEEWTQTAQPNFWLHLNVPPATQLAQHRRVEDLAQRMIYAWSAAPSKLALTQPWDTVIDRDMQWVPDPLLGVFSSVAHRLADRRLVGRLPIATGVQCLIFDGPPGGMLVAWNQYAPKRDAVIDMVLGGQPHAVDIWGNRKPVAPINGRHLVKLDTTPLFIEGIDARLALLRASFKIDPPLILSSALPQKRRIRFVNPWPQTMIGKLTLTQPKGWTLFPPTSHFTLSPGQTVEIPVTIQFPIYEVTEDKRLLANFDFSTDQPYTVQLTTDVELGLPDIDMDASLLIEPDPHSARQDVVVTQLITYKGQDPQSFYVYANLPGFPRQERLIPQMMPGQSVVRKFRFPDAAAKLQSSNVRVGIRQANGPAMLNHILSLHDTNSD